MAILLQLIYSGIALGMIYAVIAFGYQLTFATSGTLNFGQGDALMLGALVGLTLVNAGVNYWLMIPLVCVFGLAQGALVERIGVRPAIRIKSEFGPHPHAFEDRKSTRLNSSPQTTSYSLFCLKKKSHSHTPTHAP